MRLTSPRSTILVVLFALALPLKTGGCGRTACITVTSADLQNGACPSPEMATARFIDPTCPGSVTAVDGPGDLEGDLCCYPVEMNGSNGNTVCGTTTGGFGGFNSSVATASSSIGVGGFGAGGTGVCSRCADALNGTPFTKVCGTAQTALQALETCACGASCVEACDPTICLGNPPDNGCLSCLQSNCMAQLQTCQES